MAALFASGSTCFSSLRSLPASWEPRWIDWLAGTLFFNVSTFAAMQTALTTAEYNHRLWAPDAFGSFCFLLAGGLALAEVCHRWICWRNRTPEWWIVALSIAGSIAFAIAAAAGSRSRRPAISSASPYRTPAPPSARSRSSAGAAAASRPRTAARRTR